MSPRKNNKKQDDQDKLNQELFSVINMLHDTINYIADPKTIKRCGIPKDAIDLFKDNLLRHAYKEYLYAKKVQEDELAVSALKKLTKKEIELLKIPHHILDWAEMSEEIKKLNEKEKGKL